MKIINIEEDDHNDSEIVELLEEENDDEEEENWLPYWLLLNKVEKISPNIYKDCTNLIILNKNIKNKISNLLSYLKYNYPKWKYK